MARSPRTRPAAEAATAAAAAVDEAPLPRGRRATSYDVARLAGVSQSAVSRCFKQGSSISKKMRDRVMAAAARLEYQPNAIARGLITRRSNLVAVLISGRVNLYYPEVLFRLTEQLSAAGLRVLLFAIDSEADVEAILEQIWQYQADGVISSSHLSFDQYKQLEKRGIPVVFFNRYFARHSTNVVFCDPTQQVQDLVSQLVELGHRSFGLIRGPQGNMVGQERMRMVRDALAAHGLEPAAEVSGDFTYESGAAGLQELMAETGPKPTAVVCANDMMALGCMDEARQMLEFEVPGDLSIMSFDGIAMSQFGSYELTTIRQPISRMAEAAVELLVARVNEPEQSNERRVFEGTVIPGSTIGPAPRR
jgi:DNA-binding LacI/PurR family transcriptional regulator